MNLTKTNHVCTSNPLGNCLPSTCHSASTTFTTTDQQKSRALLSNLLTNPISPGHDTAPIPAGTHFDIHAPIHEAFDAGLLSGTGAPTTYTDISILEAVDYQRRYIQYRLHRGIIQPLAPLATVPTAIAPLLSASTAQQDRASKLNPSKPFDDTRAEPNI